MSDKKQTAVEWLGYELNTKLFYDISPELWEQVNEIFKQALQMECEQIEDAYDAGLFDGSMDDVNDRMHKQYYNETYGGQDE